MDNSPKHKLRTRTESQLQNRAHGLRLVRDLLEEHDIPYRLGTGALLGAYRDGDFIPWDWDVGLDVDAGSVKRTLHVLLPSLENRGFHSVTTKKTALNIKILANWGDSEFELMGWRRDRNNDRRRKSLFLPKSIWEGTSEITIRGIRVTTYQKIEDYLTHFYGNWHQPIKSTANEEYYTTNTLRRDWLDVALSLPIGRVRN